MKPRIFVTRRWPAEVEQVLLERFDATLNPDDRPLSTEEIGRALFTHDAVLPTVSDRLPAEIFSAGRMRCRILGNFGVGTNHIDVKAAQAAGLTVTNTPGVLTDCTADLAITLMLMVSRRAGEGERQLRAGQWQGWCPTHMIGSSIRGKTLGIIGMGRIGKATAARARFGFGMEILFFNRSRVDDAETRAMGAVQAESLEHLMSASDIVSLHCPGGADNRHLVNAERLALMKPSAILINTARGDVVDEAALIAALDTGRIAGVGLDVYAEEPRVPAALIAMEQVVLLPHLGSATRETRIAMGMKVVENITAFFAGETPPDQLG